MTVGTLCVGDTCTPTELHAGAPSDGNPMSLRSLVVLCSFFPGLTRSGNPFIHLIHEVGGLFFLKKKNATPYYIFLKKKSFEKKIKIVKTCVECFAL